MAWFRRTSKDESGPTSAPVLASAAMVSQSTYRRMPSTKDWQSRAWDFFDSEPELRFTTQWIANAVSRTRLYVGIPDPDGSGRPDPVLSNDGEPIQEGVEPAAQRALESLFGGATGTAQSLSRMAQHITVVGETYVAGYMAEGQQQWKVLSSCELEQKGDRIRILNDALMGMPTDEADIEIRPGQGSLMRIWRPHPRRHWEADSSLRALLSTLQELQDISAHIHASLESRLAGAGMLVLPESATLPAATLPEDSPLSADPEMAALIEAMVTAIGNRDAASAIVPIICRIADESAAKVQHLKFSTPLDDKILELRDSAIRRFAAGMDLPQEIALGLSSAVHQKTGAQVEELSIKIHIEPLLGLLCEALTTRYLWTVLPSFGVKDPQRYVIWYDTANLSLPQDRAPAARELYNMGLLGPDAVLRESGFGDHEVPDQKFARAHLVGQLALRGIPPEVAEYYLALLDLDPLEGHQQIETRMVREGTNVPGRPRSNGNVAGRSPAPSPTGVPGSIAASLPRSSLAAVATLQGWSLQAAELGVLRALEIAGKRMLSKAGRTVRSEIHCEPWRIHTQLPNRLDAVDEAMDKLLDGAYTALDQVMPQRPSVRLALDGYVRQLISTQQGHTPAAMIAALRHAGCLTGSSAASESEVSRATA